MSILTESYDDTVRRLQLLGIPADVIPGLIQYVEALNAKQLGNAVNQYSHLLRDDLFPEEVRYDARGAYLAAHPPKITDLKEFFDVDPNATGAGKYVQVVSMRPKWMGRADIPGEPVPDAVHSVVIKATGQVCKSAGWKKGPAKSTAKATKGQPLVRATLTDPQSLSELLSSLDTHGSYLYTR